MTARGTGRRARSWLATAVAGATLLAVMPIASAQEDEPPPPPEPIPHEQVTGQLPSARTAP